MKHHITFEKSKKNNIFECNLRFLLTWLTLSAVACIVYVFVVFGSLVNKTVLPRDNVPKTIPYITVPSQYDVFLEFNSMPNETITEYSGSLQMSFVARDVTQHLFFHRGNKVKINSISLEDSNGTLVEPKAGAYDKSTEVQAYIPIANLTSQESYILRIEFQGELDSDPDGPTHLSYSLPNGDIRYAVVFGHQVTQSFGLRYLMPCIDSPDFPAVFNFKIRHSPMYRVISNFPSQIQQSILYTATLFNATFALDPSQVSFALIDLDMSPVSVQQSGLMINKFYRQEIVSTISTDRIIQFMSAKTTQIGKIDVLALPNLSATQQPGITFYSENDVLRENVDLGLIGST
uniref:Aminopeptidase N-like N-terminal domain-containing protein n=1 Tax=Caenorhabditis japonica TaxID=281687 RepID=A0A8R1DEK6_CAEJA